MAEKSCDVGNTANTNDYIKTDNNDSNPDGGSNIKRVSSKSISKLQGSSNKNSNNVCLLPSCFTVAMYCGIEIGKLFHFFKRFLQLEKLHRNVGLIHSTMVHDILETLMKMG